MTDSPVLFTELPCPNGRKIGVATLNAPGSLNSLSLPMIDLLAAQFDQWADDATIALVLLQGAGDRAFCAGGDIVQLYQSMQDHPGGPNPYAEAFFTREYRLDYRIHTYPKPVVVWGTGVVMGGGIGLMCGASHRIVTETARLAMPEITIGLFPDVGGTWFLNRMDHGIGLFLALTGASINALDAIETGLADHLIASTAREQLIARLTQTDWMGDDGSVRRQLDGVLQTMAIDHAAIAPPAQVRPHHELISTLTAQDDLPTTVQRILEAEIDDKWFNRGQAGLRNGCPTTAWLVWRQLHGGRDLTLAEVFQRELVMAVQCTRHPEFAEGVRALLIDKDNAPKWQHDRVGDVPAGWVDEFFASPWADNAHPLKDLGR